MHTQNQTLSVIYRSLPSIYCWALEAIHVLAVVADARVIVGFSSKSSFVVDNLHSLLMYALESGCRCCQLVLWVP